MLHGARTTGHFRTAISQLTVVGLLAGVLAIMGATAATMTLDQRPAAADPPPVGLSTLAGSGTAGNADGTGAAASFDTLGDMVLDRQGQYLYVLDLGLSGRPNRIRKIATATGAVTTFASGGMLENSPTDLEVDAQGNVWVAVTLSSSEKAIVRYSAAGGGPTTVLSNICCGYYGNVGYVGGAFALDPAAEFLYYNYFKLDAQGNRLAHIFRVPIASLPASAATGTAVAAAGSITRDSVTDMTFGPDGKLYVIWPGSGPGGIASYPPQLWRISGPGVIELVRGGYFNKQPKIVFGNGTDSAYLFCSPSVYDATLDNGCRGANQLIRRSQFGAGGAVPIVGGVAGFLEGAPGRMGALTGLAVSPDGIRAWLADSGNRRIRTTTLPRDPGLPTDDDVICGCNPGARHLSTPTVADPVVVATGNLTETATDLAIPGRGIPLSVQRTYNSARAGQVGLFGDGWTSNLELSVQETTEGAVVRQEGGSTLRFYTTAVGGFDAPGLVTSTLSKDATTGVFTLIRNRSETITFDPSGRMTSFKDRNGYVATVHYPSATSMVVTEPGGRTLTLTLSSTGRVQSVTDSTVLARTVTYTYTGNLLTGVSTFKMQPTDASPVVWGYQYAGGRLNAITNPRGHSNFTHYDGFGRVDYQLDFAGKRTDFAYSLEGDREVTTITHPPHADSGARAVERHAFQHNLLVERTTGHGSPGARTWRYEYEPGVLGISRVIAPDGETTTTVAYDPAGNVLSSTDGLGRTTNYSYDAKNNPLTITDPSNVTTTNTYDANGNLLQTQRPLVGSAQTAKTTFERADAAHPDDVTAVIRPSGQGSSPKRWLYEYHPGYGYETKQTDPTGRISTMAYNDAGMVTETVRPKGNVVGGTPSAHRTSVAPNSFGLPLSITEPGGRVTEVRYDGMGNATWSKQASGETTSTVFDQMQRPTEVTRPDGTKDVSTYFPIGAQRTHTPAGDGTASYQYDAHGALSSATDLSGRTSAFTYDARGRRLTEQQPGGSCSAGHGCVTFDYDDADQLTDVDYSDSGQIDLELEYDGLGRRAAASQGGTTSTWAWDSLGRLTSYSDSAGTVAYGYDPSRVSPVATSITYPGQKVVTRTIDDAERIKTTAGWVTGSSVTHGYDANGNLESNDTSATTGIEDTYAWDAHDQLTSATVKQGATTLATLTFGTDADGLVTSTAGSGFLVPAQTLQNNLLDQLTGTSASPFGYDVAGNLKQFPGGPSQRFRPGGELCYSAATNTAACETPPSGATRFDYDARGNRTAIRPANLPQTTLKYDQANRLTEARVPVPFQGVSEQYHDLSNTQIWLAAGETVGSGATRTYQIGGAHGIPSAAVESVVLRLHAAGATSAGWLVAHPYNTLPGDTVGLYFNAGEAASNLAIAKLDPATKKVTVTVALGAGQSSLMSVELIGWYGSANASGGLTYEPVTPDRAFAQAVPAYNPANPGTIAQVDIAVTPGIPDSGVSAVAVVAHSISTTTSGTFTLFSGPAPPVNVSLLFDPGNSSALSVVPVGPDGVVKLTSSAATFAALDIVGYFTSVESGAGQLAHSIAPTLVAHTGTHVGTCNGVLNGCTRVPAEGTTTIQVAGVGSGAIPATGVTAAAVVINAIAPQSGGFLVAYPTGVEQPNPPGTATMIFDDAFTSGTAIVPLGTGGTISVYSNVETDLMVQAVGYFTAASHAYTYEYAPDGLRRKKTAPDGTVTTFVWDRSGGLPLLLAEAIDRPAPAVDETIRYVYAPDGTVLADIRTLATGPEKLRWYHHDQIGSTRALTNTTGAVVGRFAYTPYGTPQSSDGSDKLTNIGWAGEYRDAETGFVYLRARYYDPTTAQFLTRDPLESMSQSAYGYASSNPVNRTDPTGLIDIPGWVPVVGGKCIDIADPDCESNAERLVDSISGEGVNSACVGGQFYLVFGVKLEACWNWQGTNLANGRPSLTPGVGMGTPSAGVGVGIKHSNACDFSEVGGPGAYGGGGIGPLGIEGSAGASDFGPDGRPIVSGGGSVGKNWLPWPEAHGGLEFTWLLDW